mgnify:CR=1 FL=1
MNEFPSETCLTKSRSNVVFPQRGGETINVFKEVVPVEAMSPAEIAPVNVEV